MPFKNWISELFLTDPQLVTGKRFLKWKQILIASLSGIFLLMIALAVFGQSKAQPDLKNYQSMTAEDLNKHSVMVLSGKDQDQVIQKKRSSNGQSISGSGADQTQVITRKDRARSEYIIPAGSKISAILEGQLNSELSQSPVTATLSSAFSFAGKPLLPLGTKALGHVGQGQDSDRIAVVFDQFVLPNGHQISAQGFAIMNDGSPGIVGEFHSNKSWKVAGAIGSSFLSGAAAAFQSTQANGFGIQQPEGSTRNAILNGVAQTTLDQGKRFSEEAQNNPGYVTATPGATFSIYVEKETDLSGAIQ